MMKFILQMIFASLLFILATMLISWLVVCAVVKLVSLCFGFEFSWAIATGIFICYWLLKVLIKKIKK